MKLKDLYGISKISLPVSKAQKYNGIAKSFLFRSAIFLLSHRQVGVK